MVKNPPADAGDIRDAGSIPGLGIPGLGRYPGEGNGNALQYSYLGNPMDRGRGGLQPVGSHRSDTTEVTYDCTHARMAAFTQ